MTFYLIESRSKSKTIFFAYNVRFVVLRLIVYFGFVRCITKNLLILKKAFEGELIIPEFQQFCHRVENIFNRCKENESGRVKIDFPKMLLFTFNINYKVQDCF